MTRNDDVLRRWRHEAGRVLGPSDAELIEEVAVHLAETWTAVAATRGTDAADAAAYADLAQWAGRSRKARESRMPRLFLGMALDAAAALRMLSARPFASAGAATLVAIAIATSATVFAVAYGVIGRPLPYPQPARVMTLWQYERGEVGQISYPDYRDLDAIGAFDVSGAILTGVGTLMVDGVADRVHALDVEPAVFTVLGARPQLGRLLTNADAGTNAALISDRLWRSHFGESPSVVGRTFMLSGKSLTVTGVLSRGFDLEMPVTSAFGIGRNDVWTILDPHAAFITMRNVATYQVLARLAPGVTLDAARQRIDSKGEGLARVFPETNRTRAFRLIPLADRISDRATRPLVTAGGAAALIVLIALANLTTLALGRLATRANELALRRSLGASQWRLVRQLLSENAIVTMAGATVGALAAAQFTNRLAASAAANLPRADAIQFDAAAWLMAGGVALVLAATPQLLSLALLRRTETPSAGHRIVGSSTRRWRRGLVGGELALALVLSVCAAAVSLSLLHLSRVDPGFTPDGALTFRASAYSSRYPTRDDAVRFFQALVTTLATSPGIASASVGSSLPLSGQGTGSNLMSAESPKPDSERLPVGWQTVAPGYFAATGMRFVRGRDVASSDTPDRGHVTVINQSAARELFGDADPIGRRVSVGGGGDSGDWHEVVGVVEDVHHLSLAQTGTPRVYDMFGQHWGRTMFVVVRATPDVDLTAIEATARRAVASADPDVPVFELSTLQQLVNTSMTTERLAAELAGALAIVAIILAALGTFTVVSCSVSERTAEMAVRVALGASERRVLSLILGESTGIALAGCLIGAGGAIAAVRVLQSQLFGVTAAEHAWLISGVVTLLALVTLTAAWWPARQAARVDPLTSLRSS